MSEHWDVEMSNEGVRHRAHHVDIHGGRINDLRTGVHQDRGIAITGVVEQLLAAGKVNLAVGGQIAPEPRGARTARGPCLSVPAPPWFARQGPDL